MHKYPDPATLAHHRNLRLRTETADTKPPFDLLASFHRTDNISVDRQAGSHFSTGSTPDDGYAIYPDDPVYAIESQHAAAIKARG
ncbi:hypothetical protein LXA43DRAFT_1099608 [Ganoderma leucocontextum]|nr:hypothetical protein LXA43DRAFT_1099608 [Ganoderma leucocontextum]